jgi:hypothetical protein
MMAERHGGSEGSDGELRGGNCSPHDGQEAEKAEEIGMKYTLQRHASRSTFPN